MKRCCLGHGWECLQWQYYWIAQEKTHSMHMPPTHPPCTRIHTTHTQTHKHTHSNTQTHTCPPLLAQHANTKEPRTHRRKFSNVNKRKPKKNQCKQKNKSKSWQATNKSACLMMKRFCLGHGWECLQYPFISGRKHANARKTQRKQRKAHKSLDLVKPAATKTRHNQSTRNEINNKNGNQHKECHEENNTRTKWKKILWDFPDWSNKDKQRCFLQLKMEIENRNKTQASTCVAHRKDKGRQKLRDQERGKEERRGGQRERKGKHKQGKASHSLKLC